MAAAKAITHPSLYLRRKDGGPSEPLNAATFHQIARTLTDAIIALEGLPIANPVKSERMDRTTIAQVVTAATVSLSDLCDILERVQDKPLPLTCMRCVGRGWTGQAVYGKERIPCSHCGGAGVVEEVYQ